MKKIVLAFCIVPFILAACSKSGTVAVATATATETAAVQAAPVETAKALPAPTDTTKPDADKTPYAASVSSINKVSCSIAFSYRFAASAVVPSSSH